MIASVFSSACEEAPKLVVPVRWCCSSRPISSGCSSRAAPTAADIRPVVPEASANMTSSGPPSVVAQGVVTAGPIAGTA